MEVLRLFWISWYIHMYCICIYLYWSVIVSVCVCCMCVCARFRPFGLYCVGLSVFFWMFCVLVFVLVLVVLLIDLICAKAIRIDAQPTWCYSVFLCVISFGWFVFCLSWLCATYRFVCITRFVEPCRQVDCTCRQLFIAPFVPHFQAVGQLGLHGGRGWYSYRSVSICRCVPLVVVVVCMWIMSVNYVILLYGVINVRLLCIFLVLEHMKKKCNYHIRDCASSVPVSTSSVRTPRRQHHHNNFGVEEGIHRWLAEIFECKISL